MSRNRANTEVDLRGEVDSLKRSRSGYKSATTNIYNRTRKEVADHEITSDPILLERYLASFQSKFQSYEAANLAVQCHANSDPQDDDADVEKMESRLFEYDAVISGLRKDFDARAEIARINAAAAVPNNQQEGGNRPAGLPRIDARRPPQLEADIDHQKFLLWRPLWDNYATLKQLNERDQRTQISKYLLFGNAVPPDSCASCNTHSECQWRQVVQSMTF